MNKRIFDDDAVDEIIDEVISSDILSDTNIDTDNILFNLPMDEDDPKELDFNQ
jgi:hypothetical protein